MSKTVAWSKTNWSKTWTFFEDAWHDGNVPIMGARTHAAWLGTSVFDGARAFEGVTPDLDLHCARINKSATAMCLKPVVTPEHWMALVREGLKRFDRDAELYIRPMYWAEEGAPGGVRPDPQIDKLVPDDLRCAVPETDRHRDHAVAVSSAHPGMRSPRSQGRVPVPQQCTCLDRSAHTRFR